MPPPPPADGASLIYTSQNTPSQLPVLVHSTLGITSLLKRQPLKHNVIDRDKIVVAPNWDSWGKIRILGGTFDAELVSRGWGDDIKLPPGSQPPTLEGRGKPPSPGAHGPSAIAQYEYWCRDPNSGGLAVVESAMNDGRAVGVISEHPQEFLERQLKILQVYKAKSPEGLLTDPFSGAGRRLDAAEEKSVNDHIGPVQFNMGGIQVDADDMLQRLKVGRLCGPDSKPPPPLNDSDMCFNATQPLPAPCRSPSVTTGRADHRPQDRNAHVAEPEPEEPQPEGPAGNMAKDYDNEQLQSFFSGLMNRTAGATDGPR